MKKVFFITIAFLPLLVCAQMPKLPIDSDTHKIDYQEVVKADGVSKDDLYTRAREWFALTFKSSKDVIQMDDKSAGKIIGNGSAEGNTKYKMLNIDYWLLYNISVTVKEGRYRYEITNFEFQNKPSREIPTSTTANAETVYYSIGKRANYLSKKNAAEMDQMNTDYIEKVQSTGQNILTSLKEAMEKKASGVKSKDNF